MMSLQKMNKYTYLFWVTTFFCINLSLAQENIFDLSYNPQVSARNNSYKSSIPSNTFFVFEPIVSIPFADDFTRKKFADYDVNHYPASQKSDSAYVSHKINGSIVQFDTLYIMLTASYTYTFNTSTQNVDSTVNTPFTVTEYSNKLIPSQITDTYQAWDSYYRIRKTNLSGGQFIIDTLYIQPDKMLVFSDDSLHYVHITAGSANWKNQSVYVNGNYPVRPPSYNVATFDGLDSIGYPYNFNVATSQGLADDLTSAPFDLSSYSATNRLYLSFYYQSTGLGNQPEPEDSLTLDFYGSDNAWHRIWHTGGFAIGSDSLFYRKVIALSDPLYLHKNFSFRFRNYATLSGNLDHWHIDYVRIDLDADTTISDICWMSPGYSLLSGIQQMPYNQYTGLPADYFNNKIRNLSSGVINVNYRIDITDYYAQNFYNITVGNVPFNGLQINSCSSCNQILNPLFGNSFSYPSSTECRKFAVTQVIQNVSPEPNKHNDTLIYTQVFGDCFAYDDGSAEAAYGVTTAFAQMAVKYTASVSDTLKSVRIYFNPVVVNSAAVQQFTLIVWSDNGSNKPGVEIYRDQFYYEPAYRDAVNGYIDYPIRNSTVIVNGVFYVGLEQLNAAELNVGLDRNTNTMGNNFYNSSGTWYNTQFAGSWMIRPAFGTCENFATGIPSKVVRNVNLYPNPAQDYLNVSGINEVRNIEIINALGAIVATYNQISTDNFSISLSNFSSGLYYLVCRDNEAKIVHNQKFLIQH